MQHALGHRVDQQILVLRNVALDDGRQLFEVGLERRRRRLADVDEQRAQTRANAATVAAATTTATSATRGARGRIGTRARRELVVIRGCRAL